MRRCCFSILLCLFTAALTPACSRPNPSANPTGLSHDMTVDQVVAVMGLPDSTKDAGTNKVIYIYRRQAELITVFFIDGKIKNVEHVSRSQRIAN